MNPNIRRVIVRCLHYVRPGYAAKNIAIIILDPGTDRLYFHFIAYWGWCDTDDVDILSELPYDLRNKAAEFGGAALLEQLESSLSNALLISDPHPVMMHEDIEAELPRLAERYLSDNPAGLPLQETSTTASSAMRNEKFLSLPWRTVQWRDVGRNLLDIRFRAREVFTAAASALSVLGVILAGTLMLQPESPSQPGTHAAMPVIITDVPTDLPSRVLAVDRFLSVPVRYRLAKTAGERPVKNRHRVTKPFVPPVMFQTEPVVMMPDPPAIAPVRSAAAPVFIVTLDNVDVDPPQSRAWPRRVFGAVISAFRKIGQAAAE